MHISLWVGKYTYRPLQKHCKSCNQTKVQAHKYKTKPCSDRINYTSKSFNNSIKYLLNCKCCKQKVHNTSTGTIQIQNQASDNINYTSKSLTTVSNSCSTVWLIVGLMLSQIWPIEQLLNPLNKLIKQLGILAEFLESVAQKTEGALPEISVYGNFRTFSTSASKQDLMLFSRHSFVST